MFCGPLSMASWACCAANAAGAVCCSLASCFGCRFTSKLAKLLYVFVFLGSAILGIFLRYYGKQMLSTWVNAITNVCQNDACWGVQGVYRVSFSVTVWFAFFALLTYVVPVTHLAGWLVKLLLFILILGLSVLIPADAMIQYAGVARGFSVIFLLAQVLIILDFAYNAHEYLLRKMDEKNAEMERAGWQPGICSNCWSVAYVLLSGVLQLTAFIVCGLMYAYFGGCGLNNFFTSETIILGTVTSVLSMMNIVGRGLLPPSLIFAYNAMLLYQAITNSPDPACNALARSDKQSEASIFAGLAVSAFSVTWMAYNSAGSLPHAVSMNGGSSAAGAGSAAAGAVTTPNPAVSGPAPKVSEWPPAGASKSPSAGAAATYQAGADQDSEDEERGRTRAAGTAGTLVAGSGSASAAEEDAIIDPNAWIFHIIMSMAGMYLSMLLTNWGTPADTTGASSGPALNPELSEASMWARIGSQWAIWALFIWTLVAPMCCPNREFGR